MNEVEGERRHCPDCGRDLPQENFYSVRLKSGELSIRKACRQCYNKQSDQRKKRKKQRSQDGAAGIVLVEEAAPREASLAESNGHEVGVVVAMEGAPDALSGELDDAAETNTLIGTPDECGACGIRTGNILGDVDDRTRQQYGYLCARCHKLLTAFHASPDRMRKVLIYIEITRGNRV